MRRTGVQGCLQAALASLTALVFALVVPREAGAVSVYDKDGFTLDLGLRLQPRMELERAPRVGGGTDWQRDFLVRRSRLKAKGKMQGATFNLEWKIDQTDQIGVTPAASLENGYIQYPLCTGVDLRAGLYDQPFSRDRLTSDSRQLAVDRGAVSNVPDALGLADNVVGFEFLGSLRGGHTGYAVGLFDNRRFDGRLQDVPMVVGRLDLNFGMTKDVFQDAHFGNDKWYSLGVDGSYQGSIEAPPPSTADNGSNAAAGIDGMIDLPAGPRRIFAKAELNAIRTEPPAGGNRVDTTVWMVGMGVLLNQKLQPIVRFDRVRLDDSVGGGSRNITYVGANLYQNGHSLKIQGDVRFEAGTNESVDGARLQGQVDF